KGKLQARCEGSVQADCQAQCQGTPGMIDCNASRTASCQGSCNAEAKVQCNGYLKCQADFDASCEANAKVSCSGGCSGGGGLFCNGHFIDVESTVDEAEAWIKAHGYAHGSASASCSGNSCSAQAEGEAGTKCDIGGAPGRSAGGMVAAGLVGLAFAASRV